MWSHAQSSSFNMNMYKFVIFLKIYHNFMKDGMNTSKLDDYH
jgi:hypothetical protein